MIVKPFRGLRPRADLASTIPSVPYDVVTSTEARELVRHDPYSFLHVIKPEIDLDPGIEPHDARVYAKGLENLQEMIAKGWLVRDERPAYYVYRLVMDGRPQTGILGAAAVDDSLKDRIKKHEHTRPEKEQDRVRLNDTLAVNPGPIFLTYHATDELDSTVDKITSRDPDVHFTSSDGIEHTLWVVDDAEKCRAIETGFGRLDATYVADGHHRTAAATKVALKRRAALTDPTGNEPCNYFMAAHYPADQLRILDYNRVVKDLHGLESAELLERIRGAGLQIQADHADKRPPRPRTFGMYLERQWYLLSVDPASVPDDPVRGLDVAILTERLLDPILGIGDVRTDPRIDFVGGIRGMRGLETRVDSGRDAVAFALWPTSLKDVIRVADAGRVMPPKSTWFEPKLRSGLVVQSIDGDTL